MKVLLIFPKHTHSRKHFDLEKGMFITPLSLVTLAGCTPPEFEVKIIDEYVDIINYEEKVDLVGITACSWQAKRVYEIAGEYKKRGIPVIMGGIHASMVPEEAKQFVDSVVIGEAEEIWPEILRDFQKGKLQEYYVIKERPNLQKLIIPRWDLLRLKNYGALTIQTTRGCPYSCEFCSVQKFNGNKYRRKPIEHIVEEFKYLTKFLDNKQVFIVDDNITVDRNFAKELFKAITPFKTKWFCQSPGKIADDDEILNLMKEAGCTYMGIGFESLSKENIISMNKVHINKVEEYEKYIKKIHNAGIAVYGFFMIGNDFDTEESIMEIPEFIEKNNIVFSTILPPIPFPGTALFDRLKKENRLEVDNFGLMEYKENISEPVLIKPKNISAKKLKEIQLQILKKLNNLDSLFSRLIKAWARGVLTNHGVGYFLKTKFRLFLLLVSNFSNSPVRKFLWKCILSKYNQKFSSITLSLNSYFSVFEKQ